MTDTAESLDPLRLPLIGERLIEASAGTGKTFTIAALYLRLLLGLGGEAAYPRAISVEELLVVTFTEAATEELRGRIRSNIHELRIACLRGESDNPLYSALLAAIVPLSLLGVVLTTPLLTLIRVPAEAFDQARVYCIVVFLGGIGSLPGAMLGGLLLGVAEAQFAGLVNSDYKDVFSFALLVAILIFRPQGLLGRPLVAKV